MSKYWIGVDLDGTLAHYDWWRGHTHIGKPIGPMVAKVKNWVESGHRVKIMTARVSDKSTRNEAIEAIKAWLKKHDLPDLEITNEKDYYMFLLYDDRACQVIHNTGETLEELFSKYSGISYNDAVRPLGPPTE